MQTDTSVNNKSKKVIFVTTVIGFGDLFLSNTSGCYDKICLGNYVMASKKTCGEKRNHVLMSEH